jgi:hypothetical protein
MSHACGSVSGERRSVFTGDPSYGYGGRGRWVLATGAHASGGC